MKHAGLPERLDTLLANGLAGSEQPSFYIDAIGQTPFVYDRQKGLGQNLLDHVSAVKARGDRGISETAAFERLQNAMNPNRAMQQLQGYALGQRQPVVANPLDRFIQGE